MPSVGRGEQWQGESVVVGFGQGAQCPFQILALCLILKHVEALDHDSQPLPGQLPGLVEVEAVFDAGFPETILLLAAPGFQSCVEGFSLGSATAELLPDGQRPDFLEVFGLGEDLRFQTGRFTLVASPNGNRCQVQ